MTPPPLPEGLDPLHLLETEQDRLERFLAGLDSAGRRVEPTLPASLARALRMDG